MITAARSYLTDLWHRFGWRQFTLLVITTHLLTSLGTMAAMASDGGHIETTGFGELIPVPDLAHGGQKTLFENYDPAQWVIPSELTAPLDTHLIVMHYLVQLIWLLNVLLGYGAVGISWWLFSFTDIPELSDSVSNLIGGGATELMTWLFPSALAIGALVAYIDMKNGSALNQLLWIFISSVLGLSFAMSPNLWVNGVDNARTIGGNAVMNATANSITVDNSYPFDWPEMGASKNNKDELLRKSGDATWRALVVTPWCLTSFGSIEGCERYGKDMLALKSDEERSDYIKDTVYDEESDDEYSNGKDSPTSQWTKGNQPQNRLPFVIVALIVTLVFSVLLIVLGFASLAALIASLLLLSVGVFFALTWCIPGRPRRWGAAWFEQLIGAVLVGIIVTMVFGATLVLETATFAATASRGWGPTLGIALAIICTAFTFRRTLTSLFSMGAAAGSGGLGLAGYLALRGLGAAMNKFAGFKGAGGRAAPRPRPAPKQEPAENIGEMQRASETRLSRKPAVRGNSYRRALPPPPREIPPGDDNNTPPPPPAGDGGPGQPGVRMPANSRRPRRTARRPQTITNARPPRNPVSVPESSPAPSSGGGSTPPRSAGRSTSRTSPRHVQPVSPRSEEVIEGTVVDEPHTNRRRSPNRMRTRRRNGARQFRKMRSV